MSRAVKIIDGKKICGCCAICGTHQSELKKALAVDHNHETGQVRGLLCTNCNTAIGKLKADNGVELLKKSIKYLGEIR